MTGRGNGAGGTLAVEAGTNPLDVKIAMSPLQWTSTKRPNKSSILMTASRCLFFWAITFLLPSRDSAMSAERLSMSVLRTARSTGKFWKFEFPEFAGRRSEEHTSELQSPYDLVCRLLLEK